MRVVSVVRVVQSLLFLMLGSVAEVSIAQLRDNPPTVPQRSTIIGSSDLRALQGEAFRLVKHDPDSAKALAEHLMLLFRNTGQINQVVRTQEIVGHVYLSMGRLDSALAVFQRCRDQNLALGDSLQLSSALYLLGVTYERMGNLSAGLQNLMTSYELRKRNANPVEVIMTLNQIGIIYHRLRDYDKAEGYFLDMLDQAEKINNLREIGGALNNLGLVQTDQGRLDDALATYRRALEVNSRLGIQGLMGANHSNLARVFHQLGQIDSAMVHFRIAESMEPTLNSPLHSFSTAIGLARVHLSLGQYRIALRYAERALGHAETLGMPFELREIHSLLSRLYEALGDYRSAFQSQKLFKAFADSLALHDQKEMIDRMATQFEFERERQVLMAAQEARELVLRQRISVQRFLTAVVLVLFLIAVYVSIVAIRRNKEKQHVNQLLQESNREILLQKEQLEWQTQQLNETNQLKDRLLSIMSHDLRGPLASMTAVLELLKEGMLLEEETTEIFRQLEAMAENNTRLLDNLLIWARRQWKGDDAFEPSSINVYELISQKLAQLEGVAKAKGIRLDNKVPEGTIAFADAGTMDVVIHNLVTNAIKFSKEGDVVMVWALRDGDVVKISVSDEGVGIPPENLAKLFTLETFTTKGTGQESGTGLGLLICHDFVKANGGTISVESEVGEGTTFTITLPVSQVKAQAV